MMESRGYESRSLGTRKSRGALVAFLNLLPQWLVNGVALGSIYVLIALGFVTIYN
jgi:hypothetical protein